MADSSYTQSSFLAGEWSPLAQGRIDKPEYRMAMNVCRNGFALEEGAWVRRSGTHYIATPSGLARVIPFTFKQAYPYAMVFENGYLHFVASARYVGSLDTWLPSTFRPVMDNADKVLSDVTEGGGIAIFTTATPHGWTTNDRVRLFFSDPLFALQYSILYNREFYINVQSATSFTLQDPLTNQFLLFSQVNWVAPDPGINVVVARVLRLYTGIATLLQPSIRTVQAEENVIILGASIEPAEVSVVTEPTPYAFATFALTGLDLQDGPYLDPPTDGTTLSHAGLMPSPVYTASSTASINGGAGFKPSDVNRHLRVFYEPPDWDAVTTYGPGSVVKYNGQYFIGLQIGLDKQPDIAIAYWAISTTAAFWVWGKIIVWTSPTVVQVHLETARTLLPGLTIKLWRLGVYSVTTGFPSCGLYYQGRLFLAGAWPNRIDASMSNSLNVFSPTADDGTVADNNGISYTFNSNDTNPIFWIKETSVGVVCGTPAGEWLIPSTAASPLAPANFSATRVTTYKCADIEPAHTELTLAVVQKFGRKLLEMFNDTFSGKLVSQNLAEFAKHLTSSGIEEVRYQQEMLPAIWCRMGDGSLAGVTYKRDSLFSSQPAKFVGWHRHDLGSGRLVESIAVLPSVDGALDTLMLVTNDPVTGVRHIEVLADIFDVDGEITDAQFLDDSVTPSGGYITTGLYGSFIDWVNASGSKVTFKNATGGRVNWFNETAGGITYSLLTLYGLWHLNGYTVNVWCGGIDAGQAIVKNGLCSVRIDLSGGGLLTTAYLASISDNTRYGLLGTTIVNGAGTLVVPCLVGFTYTSQGQVVRPDTPDQVKTPTGPGPAKPRRNHQFGMLMNRTQGISFGTDFTQLRPAQFKTPGGTPYSALQLYSGVYWDALDSNWNFDGMLAWQIDQPYPAAVMSITGFMATTDR